MSDVDDVRLRLDRVARWLGWCWHRLRYRNRDATWWSIHSYGCEACDR